MLYHESAYTAPLDYLISTYIREYDISKAINVFLYKGLISMDQYKVYHTQDRMSRQIQIGILQRDNKHINEAITNGFKEVMELFFKANDIKDSEVLSIKKDAIYLITKFLPKQPREHRIYIKKGIYIVLQTQEEFRVLLFLHNTTHNEYLDVKGV